MIVPNKGMNSSFKKLNNMGGWLCFGIAALTYFLTMESSGSWWDCGEFMSAAYKLEVVHEPGSPLFLLIGRLFSLFARNPHQVYFFINSVSVISSAGTILFLFWTITHFSWKALGKPLDPDLKTQYLIIGAGFIGALAYTFSDTFWFSAVESEVYALSSLFTAFVFWAILKWENEMDLNPNRADSWILLITYAMGLSIGVHLLNLLTIPALVFIYYFKRYPVNLKGILWASGFSILILSLILFGLIPGILSYARFIDIFTVNHWSWPFNWGALFAILLLALTLFLGIRYTHLRKKAGLNLILLATIFLILGYSSYTLVILRANANPPLNNSRPDNINSLYGYLNREQYEESPLLWGPDYTSEISGIEKGSMEYRKGKSSYEEKGPKIEYTYAPGETHFFPRLWSKEKSKEYAYWVQIPETKIPSFWDNLHFLVSYQIGHMYFRYFFWNFVGRQNDTPSGYQNPTKGNWLSGISWIDGIRLGNQAHLPSSLKDNKAFNKLYFLPFLLGILGLYFQYKKSFQDFIVVLLLFFFTGLAIAIYLNMPPDQPRERDYAFVGSFYAFSIWIGMGFVPLYAWIGKRIPSKINMILIFLICLISVPLLMGFQEWDDHDRSNRKVVQDFASNYLNSCAPNAILFTNGDNETYPLWYAQEVEGIRTDIRVINLNLWESDWAIDHAKIRVNQSDPLPITWDHEDYKDGIRDYVNIKNQGGTDSLELKDQLDFVRSNDPAAKDEDGENYFPGHKIRLKLNPQEIIESGILSKTSLKKIPAYMEWTLKNNHMTKGQLMILEILQENHWKRPIYFCSTSGSENYLGLDSYLREEGITLRIVPIPADSNTKALFNMYPVNTDLMFENIMHRFRWGNINGPIHLDDQTNSFADSFKDVFLDLASGLWAEGKKDSCLKTLDRESEVLPENMPPLGSQIGEEEFRTQHIAYLYFLLGKKEKAKSIVLTQLNKIKEELEFIQSQGLEERPYYHQSIQNAKSLMDTLEKMVQEQNSLGLIPKILEIKKLIPLK